MATAIDPARLMARLILTSVDFGGADILEIGSGNGRLTFQYAGAARSVVGIDTKEDEIRSASSVASGNVRFLCASATALPFSAEQFGIVLLASSL